MRQVCLYKSAAGTVQEPLLTIQEAKPPPARQKRFVMKSLARAAKCLMDTVWGGGDRERSQAFDIHGNRQHATQINNMQNKVNRAVSTSTAFPSSDRNNTEMYIK